MFRYKRDWPDHLTEVDIELTCFRHGASKESGGLGKAGHFRKVVEMLWPAKNGKNGFVWHPWAEVMLEASCKWQYLSVCGGGGIGKSHFFAIWALVNWLCDPVNTKVLITSTTISGARQRIWGSLVDYFNVLQHKPGKLVDSLGYIKTYDAESGIAASQKSGIQVVAGDKSQKLSASESNKLMGCHNERVFLIGDELPELSETLVNSALGNLTTNPFYQFIGIGNPASRYDPHGRLSEPKDGWKSIDDTMDSWETKLGFAIRFDGEKSPNIIEGRTKWPFLPTKAAMQKAIDANGADSMAYWRMFRGFWCPEGTSKDAIYSDVDFIDGEATQKEVQWIGKPIAIGACDPAYTHGGDATELVMGLFGKATNGKQTLLLTHEMRLTEKKSASKKGANFQIASQVVEQCKANGIEPKNFIYDSTGGGRLFGEILAELWGDSSMTGLVFADAPSDIPVSTHGQKASQLYLNRVSEMWFVGLEFLRCGQLKGLTTAIIADLTARRKASDRRGGGVKSVVETKREMRKRIHRSPDKGDAYLLLVDLCRQKLKFRTAASRVANSHQRQQWESLQSKTEAPEQSAVPANIRPTIYPDEQQLYKSLSTTRKWTPDTEDMIDDYGFNTFQ